MKKIKSLIILSVIIITIVFIIWLKGIILFNSTLFENNGGNLLINETFDNYNSNSKILSNALNNISRWKDGGVITAWSFVDDYNEIRRIDLILKDSSNKEIRLNGIANLEVSRAENKIKSNDIFPDYNFKLCKNQTLITWEDFMLINGKNFLFWEWNQTLDIDTENIVLIEAIDTNKEIGIFDTVIQDGLCKDVNSLNGWWYSPNGLPQYGVWWVNNSKLRMVHVEQEQYPSNGNHVRILSQETTPKNFVMKNIFEVKHLSEDYVGGMRDNTFIRIAWDFDNIYDPGHDQTFLFLSAEYDYMGLQRVYPIERYFKQGQEPLNNKAKTPFKLEEKKIYEVDILVKNQKAKAIIYEITPLFLIKRAQIDYTFDTIRPSSSYPFSIESTGNIEILLDSVYVKELK